MKLKNNNVCYLLPRLKSKVKKAEFHVKQDTIYVVKNCEDMYFLNFSFAGGALVEKPWKALIHNQIWP